MMLIINICKEKLHYYEFVKPIEDILKNNNTKFFTRHYKELKQSDINKAEKIIICGTSLKDFEYFNDINKFSWVKDFDKPLLAICGGAQILIALYKGQIRERKEIGPVKIKFTEHFLGMSGKKEAYAIHRLGIGKVGKYFNKFAFSNKGTHAIKHRTKPFYGVLFHPEVRNKEIIVNFAKS